MCVFPSSLYHADSHVHTVQRSIDRCHCTPKGLLSLELIVAVPLNVAVRNARFPARKEVVGSLLNNITFVIEARGARRQHSWRQHFACRTPPLRKNAFSSINPQLHNSLLPCTLHTDIAAKERGTWPGQDLRGGHPRNKRPPQPWHHQKCRSQVQHRLLCRYVLFSSTCVPLCDDFQISHHTTPHQTDCFSPKRCQNYILKSAMYYQAC